MLFMETTTSSEQPAPVKAGKKEKRFQCPHCQRIFARLEHLQRHERIRKLRDMICKLPLTCVKIVEKNPLAARSANFLLLVGTHLLHGIQVECLSIRIATC